MTKEPSNIQDEFVLEQSMVYEGKASWYHATFHLITASVGGGILGLPKAFAYLNIITSAPGAAAIIILGIMFAINTYTSWCLSGVHVTAPSRMYPHGRRLHSLLEIGTYAWGRGWTANAILTFLYVMACSGTATAYLIVGGQNLQSIYQLYGGSEDTKLVYFTIGVIICELFFSLFPSLESYQNMSFVGASTSTCYGFIAIIFSFVLYNSADVPTPSYESVSGIGGICDFFIGISTVAFLFGMQLVQPDIQNTLRRDNPPHNVAYLRGLGGTYFVTVPLYVLSGLGGYLTFGNAVSDDILIDISYVSTSTVSKAFITIAQVAVVVHVSVAYQLWAMPVCSRIATWDFLQNDDGSVNHCESLAVHIDKPSTLPPIVTSNSQSTVSSKEFMENTHAGCKFPLSPTMLMIRVSHVAISGLIATAIPFFGDFMALVGSIAVIPLCFICPILFRLAMTDRSNLKKVEVVWMACVMTVASVIAIAGCAAAVRQIVNDANTYHLFM
eukprot:CFRG0756T1